MGERNRGVERGVKGEEGKGKVGEDEERRGEEEEFGV